MQVIITIQEDEQLYCGLVRTSTDPLREVGSIIHKYKLKTDVRKFFRPVVLDCKKTAKFTTDFALNNDVGLIFLLRDNRWTVRSIGEGGIRYPYLLQWKTLFGALKHYKAINK